MYVQLRRANDDSFVYVNDKVAGQQHIVRMLRVGITTHYVPMLKKRVLSAVDPSPS